MSDWSMSRVITCLLEFGRDFRWEIICSDWSWHICRIEFVFWQIQCWLWRWCCVASQQWSWCGSIRVHSGREESRLIETARRQANRREDCESNWHRSECVASVARRRCAVVARMHVARSNRPSSSFATGVCLCCWACRRRSIDWRRRQSSVARRFERHWCA